MASGRNERRKGGRKDEGTHQLRVGQEHSVGSPIQSNNVTFMRLFVFLLLHHHRCRRPRTITTVYGTPAVAVAAAHALPPPPLLSHLVSPEL